MGTTQVEFTCFLVDRKKKGSAFLGKNATWSILITKKKEENSADFRRNYSNFSDFSLFISTILVTKQHRISHTCTIIRLTSKCLDMRVCVKYLGCQSKKYSRLQGLHLKKNKPHGEPKMFESAIRSSSNNLDQICLFLFFF